MRQQRRYVRTGRDGTHAHRRPHGDVDELRRQHGAYDTTSTVHAGTFQGCQYHNAGKSRVDITSLDITLLSSPGCWAVAKETDGPGTAVPGVGDAAFGYSLGLDVKDGNRCLTIEGQTAAESMHDWGPDTVLARALLPKLPS